jgi:AraC-like DNA-binding protein
MEIDVLACNVRYPHARDYVLDLPDGRQDCWVFIHCLSPCELGTRHGIQTAGSGDCILYAPGNRQWNKGIDESILNDWIHFSGQGVGTLVQRYGIATNVMLRPADPWFINPAISGMRREIYELRPHYREALGKRAELFLLELGRRLNEQADLHISESEGAHLSAFRQLRGRLHREFNQPWNVSTMADQVNLSRSRFSVLYAKIFAVPPLEDLLNVRLQHAQALLLDQRFTVEEVAEKSGFNNAIHFYRIFRKKMGCSPRVFSAKALNRRKASGPLPHHHL